MLENNTPIELPTDAVQVTDLHQVCTAELEQRQTHLERWAKRYEEAQNKLNQIEEIIRDQIAGSMDPLVVIEENKDIMAILDMESTRTLDIRIEVTWDGTIELPYGVELEDVDIDDFDIQCGEHPEYSSNINYYFSDSNIREI